MDIFACSFNLCQSTNVLRLRMYLSRLTLRRSFRLCWIFLWLMPYVSTKVRQNVRCEVLFYWSGKPFILLRSFLNTTTTTTTTCLNIYRLILSLLSRSHCYYDTSFIFVFPSLPLLHPQLFSILISSLSCLCFSSPLAHVSSSLPPSSLSFPLASVVPRPVLTPGSFSCCQRNWVVSRRRFLANYVDKPPRDIRLPAPTNCPRLHMLSCLHAPVPVM